MKPKIIICKRYDIEGIINRDEIDQLYTNLEK